MVWSFPGYGGRRRSFATFTLAFFDDVVTMKRLEQILGIIFAITGVIGIVFFLLFLNQRVNYKLHYKVLNEIQKVVIEKYLSNNYEYYYPSKRSPFRKFKKGSTGQC